MGRDIWIWMGGIHKEGRLKGVGPEIETSPHPNPYVQPHIKNRYIGNFMDKRFQGPFRDGIMCVYPELEFVNRVRCSAP